VWLHAFLASALDGGVWSDSPPCRFTPGEITSGTNVIGDWIGPRVNPDAVVRIKKSSSCQDSNPSRPAHVLVALLSELQRQS
jgi:hypothetical protein